MDRNDTGKASSSKPQKNSKLQTPNIREIPNSKSQIPRKSQVPNSKKLSTAAWSLGFRGSVLGLSWDQGGAVLFDFGLKRGDHIRGVGGDIELFTGGLFEVEEQRRIVLLECHLAAGRRVAGRGLEMGFEGTFADSEQFVAAIINHAVAPAGAGAEENRREIHTIYDAVFGDRHARQAQAGIEQIHRAGELVRRTARFDFAWPPGDARLAHAAFPSAAFALEQRPCRTASQAFVEPRPIIAGEEDEGFFG